MVEKLSELAKTIQVTVVADMKKVMATCRKQV
jgi:hypothetical protein